jgi:hypothetical protein
MKARALINDAASFGPEALKVIGRAFDEAWASIADRFPAGAPAQSARLRLATALLAIASDHSRNVAALKSAALEAMKRPWRMPGMTGAQRHWQHLAHETRALADAADNPKNRQILLEIAVRYDRLAEIAEGHNSAANDYKASRRP